MDIDFDKAKEIYDLNVWSPIAVTKAFLPLLQRSRHEYGGALVVNNTSISGQISACVPFGGVYNSSKAAATSLTETLRLELGVLGIKVVNLVTGGVKSGFHEHRFKAQLPDSSPYRKVKAEVEKAIARHADGGMDRERWAEEVVRELGKKNPSYWVWRGGFSAAVRVANHLPVGTFDGTMKETFGLDEVERKVQELGGPRALLD
ncbi:hypothetical protein QBC47DRAFT_388970 [Echria macrotheca]|uniref:Uncharacterized protein n=1 Tax=Echria macrotheca TaxID=438768 RepID=A0AAJ0F8X9_9PEZI|nr:hypothetical protein QBC47DRAFT_388970 [Echria macrotheca]